MRRVANWLLHLAAGLSLLAALTTAALWAPSYWVADLYEVWWDAQPDSPAGGYAVQFTELRHYNGRLQIACLPEGTLSHTPPGQTHRQLQGREYLVLEVPSDDPSFALLRGSKSFLGFHTALYVLSPRRGTKARMIEIPDAAFVVLTAILPAWVSAGSVEVWLRKLARDHPLRRVIWFLEGRLVDPPA